MLEKETNQRQFEGMGELISTVDGDNYIDEGIKKHFKILSPQKDKFTFSD